MHDGYVYNSMETPWIKHICLSKILQWQTSFWDGQDHKDVNKREEKFQITKK